MSSGYIYCDGVVFTNPLERGVAYARTSLEIGAETALEETAGIHLMTYLKDNSSGLGLRKPNRGLRVYRQLDAEQSNFPMANSFPMRFLSRSATGAQPLDVDQGFPSRVARTDFRGS